ncbi:MAG: F0F1 ATP synthase subunit B [Phycisphaerales bacterium]|nr:F0F1 ATP synthase subunit B [Phycisphaerales bacterium]
MLNRTSIRLGVMIAAMLPRVAMGAAHAPPTTSHSAEDVVQAAHGASEHGGGVVNPLDFQIVPFITAIVVFGVAFFILSKMVWPKIVKGLDDRDAKIRGEILAAEEARKRADDALKEYERSLAQAKAEAAAMVEQTKAEQSRLAADLRAQAEAELNELRDGARRNIEAAKRAAIAELGQHATNLAIVAAEKILQRELNDRDQARLVEETLAEITSEYASAGA